MKKSIVKALLIANLCIPLPLTCMNVIAKNECKNLIEERTYRSDSFIDANLVGSKIDTPTLYNNYGEIQKTTNLTNYKTVYVTPSGQPALGFEYVPNGNNTVFFFYTNGNITRFTVKIDVYKYGEYQYTYYVHDPQYSLGQRRVRL